MRLPKLGAVAWAMALCGSAMAQPATQAARADALFRAGLQLRHAGLYAEACLEFAATERIAPGVGVALYLADCYEHLGQSANAWGEFRRAESLARERRDEREELARARALLLEPKLKRLTLLVPRPEEHPRLQVTLDGARVPPESWNVPLAADAGDHEIVVQSPPGAPQILHVRIEAQTPAFPSIVVPVVTETLAAANLGVPAPMAPLPSGLAAVPAAPAPAPVPAAARENPAAPVPATVPAPAPGNAPTAAPAATSPSGLTAPAAATAPQPSSSAASAARRRWIGLGLLGGSVVGLSLGAGLLALRNHELATGHDASGASTASAAAFGLGGAALVSSVVLYLTGPTDKDLSLVVSPAPFSAGAAALLRGMF